MKTRIYLSLFFVVFLFGASEISAQSSYQKNVRVGGCGATTSIIPHPKIQNLYYFTTDVGTSYRWNETKQAWEALMYNVNFPGVKTNANGNIAVDPNDETGNIVYATIGYDWSIGGLIKSVDRGTTWTSMNVSLNVTPNRDQWAGQRLLVDPNNSNVIYVTARPYDSRFCSSAAPTGTYRVVNSVPTKINDYCGTFIGFDVTGGTIAVGGVTVTKKVIMGTSAGVYLSQDGGVTFSLMSGSPLNCNRGFVGKDGVIVVTSGTGVHVFKNAAWTSYNPHVYNPTPYCALAVNPNNSSEFIVGVGTEKTGAYRYEQFITFDGGTTFTKLSMQGNISETPYKTDWNGDGLRCFAWDPFDANKAWLGEFHNAFVTTNIRAGSTVSWTAKSIGHEETVTVGQMLCPPSGKNLLHSSTADVGGFDHRSLTTPPATAMSKHFPWTPSGLAGNMCGVAIQQSDPNFIVRVGRHGWVDANYSGYSTNGGDTYTYSTWTVPPSYKYTLTYKVDTVYHTDTVTAAPAAGRIAVSATNRNMVWQPTEHSPIYRSNNLGVTWTQVTGIPVNIFEKRSVFEEKFVNPLAADKVIGDKFYIYSSYQPAGLSYRIGKMYISTDGGSNFVAGGGLPGYYFGGRVHVETSHIQNDVWVLLASSSEQYPDQFGLFRSTNGGTSFTEINASKIQYPMLMAVGRKTPTAANPMIFLYGKVNGTGLGLYSSEDNGATWQNVEVPLQLGVPLVQMAADKNGRVFLGTDGNGIFYIDTVFEDQIAPAAPSSLTSSNITLNSFKVSWAASTDNVGVTSYDVFVDGILKANVTGTNYTVTGLQANKTYKVIVTAKDAVNNVSAASNVLSVNTSVSPIPTAPTNLKALNLTTTSFSVSWTASTDDKAIQLYNVNKNGSYYTSTSATIAHFSGLTPGTTYVITVYARDYDGNSSPASAPISVTTLSGASPAPRFKEIQENVDKGFSVYPNPVSDVLKVNNADAETAVVISDMAGKIVYSGITNLDGNFELNVGKWTKGAYVVSVTLNQKQMINKIIIK